MLDTVLIGTSSMQVHSKGLKVIGNNLANVNTPGFKGSQLEFAALFEQGANPTQAQGHAVPGGQGQGLQSVGTTIDFRAGSDQVTGDPLDAKINGNGLFVVKRAGETLFTRDGNFELAADGKLVNGNGDHVQTLDGSGNFVDLSIAHLSNSMPKASTTVKLTGNISSTVNSPPTNAVVNNVSVVDAQGNTQTLKLTIQNDGGGNFTVTVANAANTTVATGQIKFVSGSPVAGSDVIVFSYQPSGGTAIPLTLDFKSAISIGSAHSISFNSHDGYVGGQRVGQSVDAEGYLSIQYANGQTQKGPRVVLADFDSDGDLIDAGGSFFRARPGAAVRTGYAGETVFGSLAGGRREGSNVDLAQEFSNLIVMQRGYQAASHVVSVANDLIQELYDMKGHR